MELKSVVLVVTLHTFFLSTLMSLGMFLSNPKQSKNQIFFGLFLSFSLITFYFFLFESGMVELHPFLAVICLPGLFLIGPMVFFLAKFSVNADYKLTPYDLRHFAPALFSLTAGMFGVYLYGYENLSFYFNFFGNKVILILGFLGTLSFIIYLVLAGKVLFDNFLWNLSTIRSQPPALASFIIFDIFIVASATDTLSLFTGNKLFLHLSMLLVSLCVILLFMTNLIFPNFNNSIGNIVRNEKLKRSYLANVDINHLKIKMNELFYVNEIYTDDKLTLKKLANMTGVSTHQLSEFINVHYQKNFAQFINEFRINKAKQLLYHKSNYTILAIAYESGFHSKSAFNDAFRKITGITPSDYKKMMQKVS